MKAFAWQGVRFLVVGGIATITDAALFWLLVRAGTDPRASNTISYPLSAIVAFLLHRKWTFAVDDDTVRQAPRFAVLVAGGLLLSTTTIWILAPWLGPLPAKAIALCGTLMLNFTLSRLLVFAPGPYEGKAA